MKVDIKNYEGATLYGKSLHMNRLQDKTADLWKSVMPAMMQQKLKNSALVSLQIFPPNYFSQYSPANFYTKWALCAIATETAQSLGYQSFQVPPGLYAMFIYKGLPGAAAPFFKSIFQEWLPNSVYQLDQRPHFEVLGAAYDKDSTESEEEVWIPIKLK